MIHDQIQKIAFLYTCNEKFKNESKKTIPFTIASKIIEHLE